MAVPPEVDRRKRVSDNMKRIRFAADDESEPNTSTCQETVDSSLEEESDDLDQEAEEQFKYAELIARSLLDDVDENSLSDGSEDGAEKEKKQHLKRGMEVFAEPEEEDLTADEMQV
ncbi:hypothetical protein GN244_ATG09639 [Phytophthora infestans]|uniref:Uncharacterized protein n=1 Tax=Phytophthora infestans TaxID=4787 RepID=A0A833T6K6_PHYIN|nr:hypothetical protein GN244_ATG09639 [Phytophthora infestans]